MVMELGSWNELDQIAPALAVKEQAGVTWVENSHVLVPLKE